MDTNNRRRIVRGLLLLVAAIAAGFILYALIVPFDKDVFATVAAALAVIASVVGVLPALRVVELQEDASRPRPMPYFDVRSRYQLVQLRLKNFGTSVAYDVRLRWDARPRNEDGKEITTLDAVPVLVPLADVSTNLGRPHELFEKYESMHFHGTIAFKDATGATFCDRFVISADEHRERLLHDDEMPRTLYDIQQIPKQLNAIQQAIAGLHAPK